MKITKSRLKKIIAEEVHGILAEAPLTRTVDLAQQRRRARRATSRKLEKDFFGTDPGLTPDDTKTFSDPDKTVRLSPARQAALDKEREVIQAPERNLRDP